MVQSLPDMWELYSCIIDSFEKAHTGDYTGKVEGHYCCTDTQGLHGFKVYTIGDYLKLQTSFTSFTSIII